MRDPTVVIGKENDGSASSQPRDELPQTKEDTGPRAIDPHRPKA